MHDDFDVLRQPGDGLGEASFADVAPGANEIRDHENVEPHGPSPSKIIR
jgi:hypothetical protein